MYQYQYTMVHVDFKVDNREGDIKKIFTAKYPHINVSYENLVHGDFTIDVDGNLIVLVERKTLSDLAASIKDGRYHNQKSRLLETYPHTIIYYLIEGKFDFDDSDGSMFMNGISKKGIVSAVINMMVRDKIKVIWTNNMSETVSFLLAVISRVTEDPSKYTDDTKQNVQIVHKNKSSSITRDNFFEIQLCQVPDVSSKTAKAISSHFNRSMKDFYDKLGGLDEQEKLKLLKDIYIEDNSGKKRRISEKVVKNIIHLMF